MKKGCLFLLALWIGMGALYAYLFYGTMLGDKWWLGPLLGLLFAIFVANLHGIIFSIKQKLMSNKPVRDWRDGDMVAFSGKLQPVRGALTAPFSGRSCVIAEYEIERITGHGKNRSSSDEIMGFMMAPCSVHTPRGPIKIVGFPLITGVPEEDFASEDDYRRAAQFILDTKFKEMPSNPFKLLSAINEVLNDPDGEVREDFKNPKAYFGEDGDLEVDDDLDDDAGSEDSEAGEEPAPESGVSSAAASVDNIASFMREHDYELEEKIFAPGTEVSIFGTYRAQLQAVNVGGGMKNLLHSMQLGRVEDVVRKNIRKSVIGSIVWGAIVAAANYYTFRMIGIDLGEIVKGLV